jgi:hypothetical protein
MVNLYPNIVSLRSNLEHLDLHKKSPKNINNIIDIGVFLYTYNVHSTQLTRDIVTKLFETVILSK